MHKIKSIKAREILDSRGNPTIEADVILEDGSLFRAAVPSGASTGKHEALELRDGGKRYGGKGVLKAVEHVNKIIAPHLIGKDCTKQREIDEIMIKLDGTENKDKLGGNAILGVSMAVCRAGAASKNMSLYKYIGELGGNTNFVLPVPMVLVLEGGKHADQSSDVQEFMIMPVKAKNFKEAIRIGSEIYYSIGRVLKKRGFNINVGFEGAYGPHLGSNEKVFQVLVEGVKEAGYKPGEEIFIAIDPAASEFYEDGKYNLKVEKKKLTASEMIGLYGSWIEKYPIISIEDGLSEDDWKGYTEFMERLGDRIQIMGDDIFVTNLKRLKRGIDENAANSILIKLNQVGTVSETIDAVNLAKEYGYTSVVSHRSGETEDSFIADFVVGMGTGQCKFGAPARSERGAKYNQLMRIEEELGDKATYHGVKILRE